MPEDTKYGHMKEKANKFPVGIRYCGDWSDSLIANIKSFPATGLNRPTGNPVG
jgi:hypothetical protein